MLVVKINFVMFLLVVTVSFTRKTNPTRCKNEYKIKKILSTHSNVEYNESFDQLSHTSSSWWNCSINQTLQLEKNESVAAEKKYMIVQESN